MHDPRSVMNYPESVCVVHQTLPFLLSVKMVNWQMVYCNHINTLSLSLLTCIFNDMNKLERRHRARYIVIKRYNDQIVPVKIHQYKRYRLDFLCAIIIEKNIFSTDIIISRNSGSTMSSFGPPWHRDTWCIHLTTSVCELWSMISSLRRYYVGLSTDLAFKLLRQSLLCSMFNHLDYNQVMLYTFVTNYPHYTLS